MFEDDIQKNVIDNKKEKELQRQKLMEEKQKIFDEKMKLRNKIFT